MSPVHLQRRDPDRNMARFYEVDVAPTLFGETSVVRSWGRIGTRGRTTFETCPTNEAAEVAAARTLQAKLRRGYRGCDLGTVVMATSSLVTTSNANAALDNSYQVCHLLCQVWRAR